jgi:hypothetical protein
MQGGVVPLEIDARRGTTLLHANFNAGALVFLRGTQVRQVQVPRKSNFCVHCHVSCALDRGKLRAARALPSFCV